MVNSSLREKWAICLGGSASKIPIVESIKAKGLKCCIIDQNSGCAAKDHADLFVNISTFDSEAIISQLEELGIKDNISIIFAYTSLMQAQYSALRISKDLNISGWSELSINYAWNKQSFKNLCHETGILTPESIVSNDINEIKNFIKEKGKVVCKPIKGGIGSESVHFINSTNFNSNLYKFDSLLFEEYLGNELYSLDGLVINNKIIFELVTRKMVSPISFATVGFICNVSENVKNTIIIKSEELLKTLKFNNTFFSFDILVHNDLFYFFDSALLLDCEVDRLLNCIGIDVFGLFIDCFLGREDIEKVIFNKKIAMAFLYPTKRGIIRFLPPDIVGDRTSNIILEYNKQIGDSVINNGFVSSKIGHIIGENVNWNQLSKMSSNIEKKIHIE